MVPSFLSFFVGCILIWFHWNVHIVHSSSPILVDQVREEVISKMDMTWMKLKHLKESRNQKSIEENLKEIARLLKPIPHEIGKVEKEIQSEEYEIALESLYKATKHTPSIVSDHWKRKWKEINEFTTPVDVLYGYFKIFPDMPETFISGSNGSNRDFEASTISDLILQPLYKVDDEKGTLTLSYLFDHAHSTVISSYNYEQRDAFTELQVELTKALTNNSWCLWNGKTAQRTIYGYYISLLTLDIKMYTVLNFAYLLQYAVNGTSNDNDILFAKQSLRNQAYEKMVAARTAIGTASSTYWRCDPKFHEEGETYEQFTELLQGVIENEKDMHPKGSCKQSCADYTFTESRCKADSCVQARRCRGDLIDCKYVAADASVCTADAPRRFEYIDYKRGPMLGKDMSCPSRKERRDSHWRFWYHCSNCFCLCDDPLSPTTVRHLSLAPVTSDTSLNKIVTGVRFVMHKKILQIQIEQGIPTKNGGIQDGSTEWKPVEDLQKHSQQVTQLDYFHRALDLDDISLNRSYVVTGVRLHKIGEHFGLMVQSTQMNPLTARIMTSTSHWVSNDNTPDNERSPRRELKLDDVDIPTMTSAPSIPDTVHDQFLVFGPTSRSSDVAQTTIPFIDIQPVRPSPPVWLKGIGIYHKGQSGFGGYVAPRVFTVDLASFLVEDVRRRK